MTYYNTTNQGGKDLKEFKSKALNQNDKIIEFFSMNKRSSFSPSFIWTICFNQSCPLTSVRRSISTLTKKGFLIKTKIQDKGIYGRPEFKWRING
jgi:hypothetical protein